MDIPVDIKSAYIETERLILRPWLESDLGDLYEYASVEGVGEMAGWKHHESIEVSHRILQSFIDQKNVFAIVHKEDGKVIGSIGMHNSWTNEEPEYKDLKVKEIGYALSKSYWGKGLMPEAVQEVIKYCFDNYSIDALSICHFKDNYQSQRVIEKCGFKYVLQKEFYSEQLQKSLVSVKYILYR